MRLLSFWCLVVVLGAGAVCHAQQSPAQPPSGARPALAEPAPPAQSTPPAPAANSPDAGAPTAAPEGETSGTTSIETPIEQVPSEPGAPAAEPPPPAQQPAPPSAADVSVAPGSSAIPSPGELGDRLVGDLAPEQQTKPTWTAPAPILTLHGYLRVRGELMDSFWLGRTPHSNLATADGGKPNFQERGLGPDPFSRFRPLERSGPQAYCAGEGRVTEYAIGDTCDVDTLQFANVRFRMSPQLNVSEDVRVKATFDVLDNVMLGTGPQSFYGSRWTEKMQNTPAMMRPNDSVFAGTDFASQTLVVRRAWAEVRNRDLGELRFGIMPEQWGLGMLYNAGNRLDDDYSTDLGRVMATTKLAGFYLSAAYDFIAEGEQMPLGAGVFRPPYDRSQLDDVDQFTFSVVRRVPDEDEAAVLERGDLLLNGGVHFQLRHQDAKIRSAEKAEEVDTIERLNATLYTPDVWGQLRYRGLRLELEAAGVFGHIAHDSKSTYDVMQFGAAFESELRLLDNKLGIYLYSGIATGDSDVEGLSELTDYVTQLSSKNDKITTFQFNPSYRVDQILWRSIMRQVTGAYYFRPGISYDFVKDDFGQLFGARLDVIWSRASSFLQTPGNDPNLGVELNAQIYWRSDDGPDKDDGYHAALQYSVLFPMGGLGYYYKSSDLDTAQSLRLILGVVY
jgi:uncharacterized protein (TIGR04551 family)